MDAFVKAAREAFNDKNIGTKELFKLMKDGKLLAKDILPLVGKYMSEAARKGGALNKMLQSNRVSMQRLSSTWQNFQNEIFMGGFGEALTRTFNSLAFALKNNEGAAKAIGVALGGLIKGFMYFGGVVHDVSLLTYHYLDKYIMSPLTEMVPLLKEISGSWVAQAAGVLIAASAFAKLAGFLWSVVKALTGISKLLPGAIKAIDLLKQTGPGITKTPPVPPAAGGGLGAILSGLLTPVYGLFASKDFPLFPLSSSADREKERGLPAGSLGGMPGLRDVFAEWGISTPSVGNQSYYQMSSPRTGTNGGASAPMMNQQPVTLNVKVVPDGTKFSDAVKVEVEQGNQSFGNVLINMMSD